MTECLKSFKQKMRDLKTTSDFQTELLRLRECLGFSEDVDFVQMEALIIRATQVRYPDALEADMVLAALGLLKGYDNRCGNQYTDDARKLLTERRKKFLKESDYIYKAYHNFQKPQCKGYYSSYEEAEKAGNDAIETIINTLGKKDGECINKVAEDIYNNANSILTYINENKVDYFVEGRPCYGNGKTELKAKLPDMVNVRRNLSKDLTEVQEDTKPPEDTCNGNTKTTYSNDTQKPNGFNPQRIDDKIDETSDGEHLEKKKLYMLFIVVLVIICSCIYVVIKFSNNTNIHLGIRIEQGPYLMNTSYNENTSVSDGKAQLNDRGNLQEPNSLKFFLDFDIMCGTSKPTVSDTSYNIEEVSKPLD